MKGYIILATCLALGAAQQSELNKVVGREVLYQTNKPLKVECGIVTELGKTVTYKWQQNGKAVPPSFVNSRDGLLQIGIPALETEGVWECLAKSELGVASSGPISLKRAYITVPKVETKKHTPVKGEPFQLECPQVDAYPKPEVKWFKLTKANEKTHSFGVRVTQGPNNFLYFANVTDEDISKDSKYVCGTVHPAAADTVVLAEHVIEGLKESTNTGLKKAVPQYLSNNIVAREGHNTFIYCIYGGAIAPPDYFFEDKNVNGDDNPASQRVTRHNRSKGRRLLIKETRQEDRGTYTCKIAEADGSTTDHIVKLAVVSDPSFKKKADIKMTAKQGDNVVIPCQVAGVPKAAIVWTYNAKPLSASEGITFNTSENAGIVANDVNIKGAQKTHSGYYGCKAQNEFGEVYTETLLAVV